MEFVFQQREVPSTVVVVVVVVVVVIIISGRACAFPWNN
jgi:hypothetical protein